MPWKQDSKSLTVVRLQLWATFSRNMWDIIVFLRKFPFRQETSRLEFSRRDMIPFYRFLLDNSSPCQKPQFLSYIPESCVIPREMARISRPSLYLIFSPHSGWKVELKRHSILVCSGRLLTLSKRMIYYACIQFHTRGRQRG